MKLINTNKVVKRKQFYLNKKRKEETVTVKNYLLHPS